MNRKMIATGRVFVLFIVTISLFAGLSHATSDFIGGSSGTENFGGTNQWYFLPITASGSGTLQNVGINVSTPSGTFTMGLWSDSAGAPNNLLGNSPVVSMSSGWNNEIIPGSVSITLGTTYWIGIDTSDAAAAIFVAGFTTPTCVTAVLTYPSYPSPPTCVYQGPDSNYNEQMTYGSSSTTTTTSTSTSTSSTSTSTSTSSTSTSTILVNTTTIINGLGLNLTSLPVVFATGFNTIPYFAIGIAFLGFGLAFARSKKLAVSMLACVLVAFILFGLSALSIQVVGIIGGIYCGIVVYMIITTKPHH